MSTASNGGRPSGALSRLLVPPDFYPERQVDAGTWAEAVFEPVALVGAVVCFVVGVVQFGLAIAPGWPARFLIPLAAVVGVEAFLYARRLAHSGAILKEWLVLLAPAIVLARLLHYVDNRAASLGQDVPLWWQDPGAFFTLDFIADCGVLLLAWTIVFVCTRWLNQLRVQPGEILEAKDMLARQLYEDNWRSVDHSLPLRQLGTFFVWGGVIVVLLSSVAAIGAAQLFNVSAIGQIIGFERPSLQLVQANVLLYFVLGLLLLGEAHFVRQRTLWRLDRIAMPAVLPGRWVGAAAGLVVVGAIVAMILPTSYAMTLGDLISTVVAVVAEIMLYAAGAIFFLFYLVASLLGGSGSKGSPPPAASLPHLPATPPPAHGASPLDTVRSLVFWAIALGIVLYSLSVLWRKRGPGLGSLPLGRILRVPFAILGAVLGFMLRLGRGVGVAIAAAVPRLFRAAPPVARQPLRFLSLSRLGPRELVEYFYLSVCERAAQLGLPRPPGMTPVEYQALLRERLPLVDPELDAVTAAFLRARYGPRPTTTEEARQARGPWDVLKRKLRAARLARRETGARQESERT